MKCPKCEKKIGAWQSRSNGRRAGYCACNPAGPVVCVPGVEKDDELLTLPGVNIEVAMVLHALGIHTLADVRAASDDVLLGIPGIGEARLNQIRKHLSAEVGGEL